MKSDKTRKQAAPVGVGPTNVAVKVLCLTAWLRGHNRTVKGIARPILNMGTDQ